jgi:hypothetical protein
LARVWINGSGLALSAANLNALEADVTTALGVPDAALATRVQAGATKTALDARYALGTSLASKEPVIATGTSAQYIKGDKTLGTLDKTAVGLSVVDNTADANKPVSAAQSAAIDAAVNGVLKGDTGGNFRVIACTLRNTGSGFAILNDANHEPIGVTSVTTAGDNMSLTLNYSFTATQVGALVVTADDTLATLGYVFGSSVGLTSSVIYASQPGGWGDYLSWNGSAWVSLNGYITSASMNGTTGEVTANHASMTPIGGSVVSRSDTKRASMEGLGATTTNFKLMDNAGVSVKTPTTDNRVWIQRAGARQVPMTELIQSNSNIWVFGIMRTN